MTAWLRTGSLRRKLTTTAVVAIVVAQMTAATVLVVLERNRARESLLEDLQSSARVVVDNVAAALSFGYHDEASETLRALGAERGFEHACVYDQNAELFAAHLIVGGCDPAPGPDGARFGSALTINTPIAQPDRGRIGTLSLQSSLQPVADRVREQIAVTLVVLLVSTVGALLLMVRLQRQLTAPLQDLASTAQAVSRDRNYDRRVRQEADDEVGAVAAAFNDMLSQIKIRGRTRCG
jgi:HAMP domain-containing protein